MQHQEGDTQEGNWVSVHHWGAMHIPPRLGDDGGWGGGRCDGADDVAMVAADCYRAVHCTKCFPWSISFYSHENPLR